MQVNENRILREIQERILNRMILLLCFIAIPALSFSLFRYFEIGWQPTFYFYSFMAFTMILFAFYRKRIPYHIKTSFLLLMIFSIGISASLNFGLSSFMFPYYLLSVLIGVLFLGKKHAILVFFTGAISIVIVGFLIIKGIISPEVDFNIFGRSFSAWLNSLAGFTFVTTVFIFIAGDIGYLLSGKISELQRINDELKTANNEIIKLQGILPICVKCKKIKDNDGYWSKVESYIEKYSEAQISHGLCEQCSMDMYGKEEWFQDAKLNENGYQGD